MYCNLSVLTPELNSGAEQVRPKREKVSAFQGSALAYDTKRCDRIFTTGFSAIQFLLDKPAEPW